MTTERATSREILRLAVPAFLALIAEPLFLLVDSAVVGRLGVVPLAGLGAASAVLLTATGLFVFLAYGTTSAVARHMGAGHDQEAISSGIGGVWLAVGLGGLVAGVLAGAARPLVIALGASPGATDQAVAYLRISALGVPAMLVVLAATGILRGLLDTRTPLIVATVGFTANAGLNIVLVLGLGWGIAGAAWGTVIAQAGMAAALVVVVIRHARAVDAGLRPHPGRVLAAARDGVPLLVRTLALRAILLLTVAAAASFGDVPLAAYQVSMTIWSFLVFALDALAIAAQALTGRALGAGDVAGARRANATMIRWGVGAGVVLGLGILAVHTILPRAFTPDIATQQAIATALIVIAIGQPLSGYVFVIDGVLIGAGDGRWLAWSMIAILTLYAPVIWLARSVGADLEPPAAMVVLWVAFTAFMAIRAVFMAWRIRGDGWAVVGATR
ncbi:MATE family efflux transporter [Janibacter sp. GXQ6167]|uniref:MATE family efflux transporter n=1 Tax=Janibacter sp. GXQ6167 TaxID=3240791 RepID=UPI00352664B2